MYFTITVYTVQSNNIGNIRNNFYSHGVHNQYSQIVKFDQLFEGLVSFNIIIR